MKRIVLLMAGILVGTSLYSMIVENPTLGGINRPIIAPWPPKA